MLAPGPRGSNSTRRSRGRRRALRGGSDERAHPRCPRGVECGEERRRADGGRSGAAPKGAPAGDRGRRGGHGGGSGREGDRGGSGREGDRGGGRREGDRGGGRGRGGGGSSGGG